MTQGPLALNVALGTVAGVTQRVALKANLSGALAVNQYLGKKFEYSKVKNLYAGGNSAGVQLSAGLATTYIGCCLSNPAGSTVNLVVRRAAGMCIIAPAALLALGLITGWSAAGIVTHTVALVPKPSNVGDLTIATQAKLDAQCTLVGASTNAPGWSQWFAGSGVTASGPNFNQDIEGGLLIPPGGYAAIGANVAGPAAGFVGSFEWIEVPFTA